jgi:hypothetical protein
MSTNHSIPLTQAVEMTATFRANRNTILDSQYRNEDVLPLCETFTRSSIEGLLAQQGCEGFRIYYGMDENLKIHAILVGVNGNNADILPLQNSLTEQDPEGTILEDGQRCPPYCPAASPLNTD